MDHDHDFGIDTDRANILIVDDRPDKLLVLHAILEDLQQNIFTVASGEDALRQILERDFAVILLDVDMPGLDGLETASLIRSRKRSAHIPIIFVTAYYSDELHTAQGYSLGAVDYIVSPVVPEILRAKVKVFVDLYLLAQKAQRQAQEHIALAEEKAARAAAERATRRLAFLAQASAALASSLDFAATTREIARLVVPFLADVSALTLASGDGDNAHSEVAWVASDAEAGLMSRSLSDFGNRWLKEAIQCVQHSGQAESYLDLAGAAATVSATSSVRADALGWPTQLHLDSLIMVPLLARGRTLGVLSLGLGPSGRRFDENATSVATELASRAAIALDNALLYKKIQDEDRRKNEFLAMLAHELRNPLAPISNAIYVLQTAEGDLAKYTWARDIIARQLRQLIRLVDDLLDMSRITRGKIELKVEAIDVAEVVAAAVETSRPNVDALEHSLTVLVPAEPLRVKGDFARVAQILANLINNAAKYTERGGRISLTATLEKADVVFRVRDSGIGIPKESLSKIFDAFTQVDSTLDRSQGGLGIGLTLVRRLVEMQGGSVAACSEGQGRGSEFTVRLPAAPSVQRMLPAIGEAAVIGGQLLPALCILVVDDNRDVAESTAVLLRMAGCEVHMAYDGSGAVDAVQRLRPDAVLLDIGLPGMDGYQVADRLRSRPENRRTLLVAVSGYGQDEHKARSKTAGFDYHIVKPIDAVILTRLLGSLRPGRPVTTAENVVNFPQRISAE